MLIELELSVYAEPTRREQVGLIGQRDVCELHRCKGLRGTSCGGTGMPAGVSGVGQKWPCDDDVGLHLFQT